MWFLNKLTSGGYLKYEPIDAYRHEQRYRNTSSSSLGEQSRVLDTRGGDGSSGRYLLGGISQFFRDKAAKREHHKQDICKWLRSPVSVGSVTYDSPANYPYDLDRPTSNGLRWIEDSELYPFCISHLKKYGDILILLEEARKYSEDRRTKALTSLKDYVTHIDNELKSFKALPAKDRWEGATPHYDKPALKFAIFNDIVLTLRGGKASSICIEKSNPSILKSDGLSIAAGDETSLGELEKLIHTLEIDDKIVGYASDFLKFTSELHNNPYVEDFEARKRQIVRELTLGQRELKGHCDLCP
jgi:hypothetical protein